MLLENTTVGKKTLTVRTKRGLIEVAFESGEVKDVPDTTVELLKTNSANMMYFNRKIIRKVTKTNKKVVKPDVKETRETANNPEPDEKGNGKEEKGKGKGKEEKGKGKGKGKGKDDDLDL